MERLRKRQDFIAAARALSSSTPGLVLQARDRCDDGPPRVGFTVTRKLGKAVQRNHIRRRLREAARIMLDDLARPGFDYVIIGRSGTAGRSFEALKEDLRRAVGTIHASSGLTGAPRGRKVPTAGSQLGSS